ncbi:MAG: hypothetical protein AABZ74_00655, partial [Cyanobacteriota bacterium]
MLKKLLSGIFLSSIITFSASAKSYYMKFNDKDSKMTFLVSTTLHDFTADVKKFKGNITINADDSNDVQKA